MVANNTSHQIDNGGTVEEQAAAWFAKMSSEAVSEADCREFRTWREHMEQNAAAYDRISTAWDTAGKYADASSIVEMRLAALSESPQPSWYQQYGRIAAAVALVLFGALALMVMKPQWLSEGSDLGLPERIADAGDTSAALVATPAGIEASEVADDTGSLAFSSIYSTRVGQMAEFALPDGSSLALNTASRVRVEYTAGARNLVLEDGEAVFTVAKDRDRPFTVAAGKNRVVALGTVFSVRNTGGEAKITLIEGRVRVENASSGKQPVSAHMVAGEELRVLPDQTFEISKAEIRNATSWRNGRLVFDQTPLREVLEEFNRYSNQKHVLRDEDLGDFLVNGTFRIKSSEHFAATLEAGFPVVVRARSGGAVFEVSAAEEFGTMPTGREAR